MKLRKSNLYFSIHYSFLIIILCSFLINIGWLVLLYFLFLVLHELVHYMVAKKLGYKLGKIKLMATGAILEAESDEFSFIDEIKISISAPLFNLFISIIILGLWWIAPEIYNYTQDIFVINLAIFSFNILPIFPLDGGRVLLAFLSTKFNRKVAVKTTKMVSIILILILFSMFICSFFITPNFSLGIMAVTLFMGVIQEDKDASYKRLFFLNRKRDRLNKTGIETRYIMVSESIESSKLFKYINARFFTIFLFVDENFKIKKRLSENEIINK